MTYTVHTHRGVSQENRQAEAYEINSIYRNRIDELSECELIDEETNETRQIRIQN